MVGALDIAIERLLDRAVARAVEESPRAAAVLAALKGRRLAIRIEGTPFAPLIESTGRSLKALRIITTNADTDPAPDAAIVGAPLALLQLNGEPERAQALIARGAVRIEGDAEIAQQFRELSVLMRPDVEAGLAGVLGRSGAHLVMRGVRAAGHWSRAAAWTSVRNLAEYLAHESADLVSRAEAEHFLRGVDEVRDGFDRIEARLRNLERRAGPLTGVPSPDADAS
ncbi:MAG TPA: SCP2 sterol-binding domain-containing protein [Steroidobacteraceae bacterium]